MIDQYDIGITEQDWADIPSGEFMMGSPASEAGHQHDERLHPVQINGFRMLKTFVTFEMFDCYCDVTQREKPLIGQGGRGPYPAVNISYWEAVDYCLWLSETTGWVARLPTEAEWEYVCRAGTTTSFWSGQSINMDQAHYLLADEGDSSPDMNMPLPENYHMVNPWGLSDMHGNIWEWCASIYDKDYEGDECLNASTQRNNHTPRILRGGSWMCREQDIRSAKRHSSMPSLLANDIGFRLVLLDGHT